MNSPSTSTVPEHGLRIAAESDPQDFTTAARVLLIDREQASSARYAAALEELGCDVLIARSPHGLQIHSQNREIDLCVHRRYDRDDTWPTASGSLLSSYAKIPRIVIADAGVTYSEREAVSGPPFLFLNTPLHGHSLQLAVQRAIESVVLQAENEKQFRKLAVRGTREIVGHSPVMGRLRDGILQHADSDGTVLIQGEPGSGKQTVARALHDCSARAHRPFITVDCSLLTAACLERELFGEEEQISWGGEVRSAGCFDLAAGGTCVLYNIDEMALMLQAVFAEVLHQRRFRRLGATEYRPLDTKMVATTRYDLASQSRQGLFRPDLLGEIAHSRLTAPPLKDRREDIAALAEHFLRNVSLKQGKPVKRLCTQSLEILTRYPWPGNVRELENLVERACALDGGPKLTPEMIRPWLHSSVESAGVERGMTLKEMERKLIESAFTRFSGNRDKTAQALGIGLRTLSGKLRDYGYPPRGGPGSNRSENRAA